MLQQPGALNTEALLLSWQHFKEGWRLQLAVQQSLISNNLSIIALLALSAMLLSTLAIAYQWVCLNTEAQGMQLFCPINACQIQGQGSWSAQEGSSGWLCSRAPSASSRSSISGSAME